MGESVDQLNDLLEKSLYNIFLPNILRIILPVIILGFIFTIIKIVFIRKSQSGKSKIITKTVINLIFLVLAGIVTSVTINNFVLEKTNLNDTYNGYNPFDNPYTSEDTYSGYDPFENPYTSEDTYSGYDPFKNPYDEEIGK